MPTIEAHLRREMHKYATELRKLAYTVPNGVGEHDLLELSEVMNVAADETPEKYKHLRRRRDFARQRWPCGQHKIAVWRLAPTAAPRIPRVNLPMAAPFGLGSRRGICVYHRRCGTTSSARRERPLVHIRTRICAGDPVPLKPATLLPSSATICRSGILKRLRRFRDFARKRWPCGQHKAAVWRVAPTAAPRIPCVNLPMAVPFGLGSRRGICVYHRRCGTTSSARRERPLVHIRTRICA